MKSVFSVLFCCALLAGCASYSGSSLVPGQSATRDVEALMGPPAARHPAPAGRDYAESWEYPRGPYGRHTFMVRVDKDGRVVRIDQVLSLKGLAEIKAGESTREDVRRILGRPAGVVPDRRGGEWWDYAAYALEGGMRKIRIAVSFDARGVVTDAGESFDPEEFNPLDGGGGSTL